MLSPRFASPLAIGLILATSCLARFAMQEVVTVPMDRLAKNLQAEIDKNPKDVQAILNLGRVYAMAYSLRSTEVPKDDPVFAPLLPFENVTKTDDKDKLKAANECLGKAVKLYEKAVELEPKNLKARLGHGWLLTQTARKSDAIDVLRKVVADAWEQEKEMKELGLTQNPVTAESAKYLIPLLDNDKDKVEIATLKKRTEHLLNLPRPITPIAIPLRDGLSASELEDRTARVCFDADGSGLKKRWTWINRDAAWLVYDPNKSGKITSSLQLFGNTTFWLFWETGYDALSALDDNHDGELTGDELVGLALWHDVNGDGICQPGEVKPLADYGIIAISCRSKRDMNHPDRIAFSESGVTFKDGKKRPTFDLILHPAK